jgi:hypothetical protein
MADYRKWPDAQHYRFMTERLGQDEYGVWLGDVELVGAVAEIEVPDGVEGVGVGALDQQFGLGRRRRGERRNRVVVGDPLAVAEPLLRDDSLLATVAQSWKDVEVCDAAGDHHDEGRGDEDDDVFHPVGCCARAVWLRHDASSIGGTL